MNLPEKMADKFNREEQLVKLLEELGECTAVTARIVQLIGSMEPPSQEMIRKIEVNFIDEIIDVEFLFAQMRYFFDGFEEAKKKNDEEIEKRFFSK